MADGDEDDAQTTERRQVVRLVGREEAEAAIQSGTAVGRRNDQRSAERSAATGSPSSPGTPGNFEPSAARSSPRPGIVHDRARTADTTTPAPRGRRRRERVVDLRVADKGGRMKMVREDSARRGPEVGDAPSVDSATPPRHELPHWTEPPSGEVPAVLASDPGSATETPTPRWRDHRESWSREGDVSFADLSEASGLGESVDRRLDEDEYLARLDATGGGAQVASSSAADDERRSITDGHDEGSRPADDEGSSDGDTTSDQQASAEDQAGSTEARGSGETSSGGGGKPRDPGEVTTTKSKIAGFAGPSLYKRVTTGLAFAATAILAFSAGPAATMAMVFVIVMIAAMELYDGLRRAGHRPATLLGLTAVAGTLLGAYARGEQALALMLFLTVVFGFLWFLVGASKAQPTSNVAVTLMGYAWVGVLGSFAALLLREPRHHGMAFLMGAIVVTVAYDTGAYVGGNLMGRRPLAPSISPNKTWEGLLTGTVAAIVTAGVGVSLLHPWTIASALTLGVVVSCVAPLGDLAESMIKRDLEIKDMGRVLPGHGGLLDRFDALLFVLPATYYLAIAFNLG